MVEALIDNDVVIAMARYDLMTEFDTILRGKCSRPLRCCPLAQYSLRLNPSKPLWKRYPTNLVRDRVRGFIDTCKAIPNTPCDATLMASLLRIPGIDDGEAMLIDYAIANPSSTIITGDQTCSFTIATDERYKDLRTKLAKRIVHLECLFETLHDRFGVSRIRQQVISDPQAHDGLTGLLGAHRSEATAKTELSLRVQTMEVDLQGMLVTPF